MKATPTARLLFAIPAFWLGVTVIATLFAVANEENLRRAHPPIPPRLLEDEQLSAATGGVCVSCHTDKGRQAVVHPAITMIGCEGCHTVNGEEGEWTAELGAEGNELCFLCHDDKKPEPQTSGVRLHPPAVEGECLACHDPHESEYSYMLRSPVEDLSDANLCFGCHINVAELAAKETVHGAMQMGCLLCHQTHKGGDASEQQFAFHLAKDAPALCLDCHDGADAQLESAHAGQPFQSAVCTDCHNPHGSDRANLIHPQAHPPFADKMCEACHEEPQDGKVVLVEEGRQGLCFMCHVDKQEQISSAKAKHSLLDFDDTCTGCHSPHASDQPSWLRKPVRALCGDCHEDQATGEGIVHQPVEWDGSCSLCHESHASDFPQHLRADVNDLCLKCHGELGLPARQDGMVTLFDQITLPASLLDTVPIIAIRAATDAGHPLMGHPVSGENTLAPEKGAISCVSCHRPHGVKLGRKLFVTESDLATPVCVNCH